MVGLTFDYLSSYHIIWICYAPIRSFML